MFTQKQTQATITFSEDRIDIWAQAFLTDRTAAGLSKYTIRFYAQQLGLFLKWTDGRLISRIGQLSPASLREYIVWLMESHNPGGQHAAFRALRAFLRWYWDECEPEGRNPIERLKAPKVNLEPLSPANLDDVQRMLKTCDKNFTGERDRAIMQTLLDTGLRAAELLAMDCDDLNPVTGEIIVRCGKGGKSRTVYLGQTARRQVRKYLKTRTDHNPALWVTDDGNQLSYGGLRSMITRRAALANVDVPELHSFRRAFALAMLRSGTDVFTLQKLLVHSDLQVLRRYLAQTDDDLKAAHALGSPADKLNTK